MNVLNLGRRNLILINSRLVPGCEANVNMTSLIYKLGSQTWSGRGRSE